MKELTIEQKAQRYDKAIIKAKALYDQPLVDNTLLETIFPELKESEDEKIRKELMDFIYVTCFPVKDLKKKERFLDWLEKQGEQTHAALSRLKVTNDKKLEPKFKVGDWLQYRYAEPFLVEEITEQGYCNGDSCLPFEWEDEIHLWTIQDAKDGDVLVDEDNNIGLYLEEKDDLYWHSCIYLGCDDRLRGFSIGGYHNHKNTHPATKEQRDMLFRKMKEAGYEWNSDKKELKKMEVVSKENEDEKIRKWLIGYFNQYILDDMPQVFGNGLNVKDVIAWLEKQGKEEYALKSFRDKDVHKFMQYIENEAKAYEFNLPNRSYDIYAFAKDILYWLEKQGEQKPVDKVEPKFHEGDIVQYITDSTDRRKIEEIDTLCNMYHTDSSPIMFEIEDEWKVVVNAEDVEQESVDKVEPKFKEQDWIIHQGTGIIYQVVAVIDNQYQLKNGDYTVQNCADVDRGARLYDVAKDAKDGDVLVASDGSIFLFAGVDDCACKYYVALTTDNYVKINKDSKGGYWETSRAVYPATKEQRDLLFHKMADAGYEWDTEKKELDYLANKIEPKTLNADKVIE